MKNKLLAILALIVFSLAVLMPEVLISLNSFALGKLFFIALLVLFTNYNVVAGIVIAILIIYLNNLSYEGMETMDKPVVTDKKVEKVVDYSISGSNMPSTLDKDELSKQLTPVDTKSLPTFSLNDKDTEPEPENPAVESFTLF